MTIRRISPKQHGFVDYLFAASVAALPRLTPASERLKRLLAASGLAVAALGALTKYELGVVKVLPMKGHLALDYAIGPLFAAAPALLPAEDRNTTRALAALGLVGTATALLTRSQ